MLFRSYVPHVTLVRDARGRAVLPAPRFTWDVREFVLAESGGEAGANAGYAIVGRWPLT